jgi:opacity protein-like surface antigen
MSSMKRVSRACFGWALAFVFVCAAAAHGQAVPSAHRGAQSLWLGAEYSNLHAGFPYGSSLRLSGAGVFATYNWDHHYAVEGHARFLNQNSWYGETEQDYLAGPRYTFLRSNKWRPYASFQAGIVKIQYPFSIGNGSLFALAPGGGIEYRMAPKWALRGSYEYQILPNSPNFTDEPKFGIRPNGFQFGIAYRMR